MKKKLSETHNMLIFKCFHLPGKPFYQARKATVLI